VPLGIEEIGHHHLYAPLLNARSIVIDLGACEGAFANAVSERWGARVFAIEANPTNYSRLRTAARVSKHLAGISDRTATARLFVAENADGHSLDPRHRDVGSDRFVEIPTTTLADFLAAHAIDRVDLLKVDIEGAEIALFRSLDDKTLQRVDQLTVEFHDFIDALDIAADVEAIKRRMARLGFWTIVYTKPNIDVLFLNRRALGGHAWRLRLHRSAIAAWHCWREIRGVISRLRRRRMPFSATS
jgi:FkbM family methyltransferase